MHVPVQVNVEVYDCARVNRHIQLRRRWQRRPSVNDDSADATSTASAASCHAGVVVVRTPATAADGTENETRAEDRRPEHRQERDADVRRPVGRLADGHRQQHVGRDRHGISPGQWIIVSWLCTARRVLVGHCPVS